MVKSGGDNNNLLRICGFLFAVTGAAHVLRFQGIDIRFIQLTRLGSLIYGILILALSAACFIKSRK